MSAKIHAILRRKTWLDGIYTIKQVNIANVEHTWRIHSVVGTRGFSLPCSSNHAANSFKHILDVLHQIAFTHSRCVVLIYIPTSSNRKTQKRAYSIPVHDVTSQQSKRTWKEEWLWENRINWEATENLRTYHRLPWGAWGGANVAVLPPVWSIAERLIAPWIPSSSSHWETTTCTADVPAARENNSLSKVLHDVFQEVGGLLDQQIATLLYLSVHRRQSAIYGGVRHGDRVL